MSCSVIEIGKEESLGKKMVWLFAKQHGIMWDYILFFTPELEWEFYTGSNYEQRYRNLGHTQNWLHYKRKHIS